MIQCAENMATVSFIIPVYNSEKTIAHVVEAIINEYRNSGYFYEIILVDDGSSDRSFEVCKNLVLHHKFIRLIHLTRNFGQHNALLTGMRFARGRYTICLDDDLETPPKESKKLLHKIVKEQFDIVFGSYQNHEGNFFRILGTKGNDYMSRLLLGKPKNIKVTSYFVIEKTIKDALVEFQGPYVYLLGLMLQVTDNFANVPIEHESRKFGKSNYTFKKLFALWLNGFTNFSILPLKICTISGFLISSFGFIFALIMVIQKLLIPKVLIGYTSLLLLIVILGGLNLLFIGLIGEYVGKIFLTVNHKPQSIIASTLNAKNADYGK